VCRKKNSCKILQANYIIMAAGVEAAHRALPPAFWSTIHVMNLPWE
jgi:hypothetical protein